jgi:hypothetical protein
MIVDEISRLRTLRIMIIIGALFLLGFCFIGLLIKDWLFALIGLFCGSVMWGIGLGLNYAFKSEARTAKLFKLLTPVLYIVICLQILIAIGKLAK